VLVLSYDSFRSNKKDGRRSYRENSQLKDFPVSETLPDGADETSLVNAINVLNPIVIVDESHHTTSSLSVEMLNNFNPRFILDLTATPRENSNIIAFAEATELKRANMVKLPLIVYNRHDKKDVMQDAIWFRAQLEKQAIEEEKSSGKYIRPIVLFQVQPRNKEDVTDFQKLKAELVKDGIPENQIAIKTTLNELKNVNLISRSCEIRYIITVNALKEGWDCSFAYVLATLANKTSKVDVEQIVGRVLRQPYATRYSLPLLNNSFVLTCSNDFATTLDSIVKALNSSGFDEKDLRVSNPDELLEPEVTTPPSQQGTIFDEVDDVQEAEFLDDYSGVVRAALEDKSSSTKEDMVTAAVAKSREYERETEESEKLGYLAGLEGAMKNQYKMNDEFCEEAEALLIPQFCFVEESNPSISLLNFTDVVEGGNEYVKLRKEKLSDGFDLPRADSNVDFSLSNGDMYYVDATDKGVKYKKLTPRESENIKAHMERLPDEGKKKLCINLILSQLEKHKITDVIPKDDLRFYVELVVRGMSNDEFTQLQTGYQFFAYRIRLKIESLLDAHREKRFMKSVKNKGGEIQCRPLFKLPQIITPTDTHDGLVKSLYESEAAMNSTERKVIDEIAALDIRWWHRISERKNYSFYINGFINHYPDFLIMTNKGNVVVVEVKGDDRDNSDSERKLRLGLKWEEKAGDRFYYFMVFDNVEWDDKGAWRLPEFIEQMKKL
jgi:type III restriction enzyme